MYTYTEEEAHNEVSMSTSSFVKIPETVKAQIKTVLPNKTNKAIEFVEVDADSYWEIAMRGFGLCGHMDNSDVFDPKWEWIEKECKDLARTIDQIKSVEFDGSACVVIDANRLSPPSLIIRFNKQKKAIER